MSSGKGPPSHFWNRNNVRSILPGLRRKRTGLLLSGPKSSFQIKVNFAFDLEIKVWSLEKDWRGTESKLLEFNCVLSSPKSMQPSTRRFWSTLCFHLLTSFMEMLFYFSMQQDFGTCPQCQNHFQVVCWPWFNCAWLASQHAWPEPHMESMGYFQEKDEKRSIQQSRRAEGSIVPQQCHRQIASMPHLTDAGVCAKGALAKYWMHEWKELELFCFANPFFILILGNILIFWDTLHVANESRICESFTFWNKLQKKKTFSRYSNFLSCTCRYIIHLSLFLFSCIFYSVTLYLTIATLLLYIYLYLSFNLKVLNVHDTFNKNK